MKINEITVGRKFNVGNFQSLEIRVSAEPSPEQNDKDWRLIIQEMLSDLDQEIVECGKIMVEKAK